MIKELATDENFRTMLQIDPDDPRGHKKVQKMQDVELVLRFYAMIDDNYKNLKKGFREFLSDEMERLNNVDELSLSKMKDRFVKTMDLIRKRFGDTAFAKYKRDDNGNKRASKFNAAVFDALVLAITSNNITDPSQISDAQIAAYRNLFRDQKFFDSVSGSVNDR